ADLNPVDLDKYILPNNAPLLPIADGVADKKNDLPANTSLKNEDSFVDEDAVKAESVAGVDDETEVFQMRDRVNRTSLQRPSRMTFTSSTIKN
ncbi:hypothetical protein N8500_08085, partial [Candidatus Puniceispirillum sp.]|nr:hypothetical protein [Candidatus Puniceispirillum sp.]